MKFQKYVIVPFLFAVFGLLLTPTGCRSTIKFDSTKWALQDDPVLPPIDREYMLDDLLDNHKIIGLSYSNLINMLGIPDGRDRSSINYNIIIDFGTDIDPVYSKNLVLYYSPDSIITRFEVTEYKKP